jgi:DNA-binding NtrC family response regulator
MRQNFNKGAGQRAGPDLNEVLRNRHLGVCASAQPKADHTRAANINFIGKSPAFKTILEMVKAIASRMCPVIITGETGVGKEMVARQIHSLGDRAGKVFVPVDCTTLTGQYCSATQEAHLPAPLTVLSASSEPPMAVQSFSMK